MNKRIFLVFVFILGCLLGYGQSEVVRFGHIGIEDGLSQGSVISVLKDSRGFMWFGTQGGLNRYDGYEFKIWAPSSDTTSLSNNFVVSLAEDKNGNIWMGTFNGLNKLEVCNNKIVRVKNINGSQVEKINVLYKNTEGDILVGHSGGISKLVIDDHGNEYFDSEKNINELFPGLAGKDIQAIHEDKVGSYWVGTKKYGLYHYYIKPDGKSSFKQFKAGDTSESITFNYITSITSDPFGNVWVGTDYGLNKINTEENTVVKYHPNESNSKSVAGNKIASVYYGRINGLWVGTFEHGVSHYNYEDDSFETYVNDPFNENSLSDNNWIKSIYEDNTGILWLGTLLGGVNKYEKIRAKFNYYNGDINNPNLFKNNGVRSIHESNDENGIWIGSINNGVYYYDKQTQLFTHYTHDPKNINSLQDNQVRSVTQDNKGSVWVGLRKKGVCRMDFNGSQIKYTRYVHNPNDPNSLPYNQVSRIFSDKNGGIWVVLYNGALCKYNPNTEGFTVHIAESIHHEDVRPPTSCVDSRGQIWLGTYISLRVYDPVSKKILKTYKHDDENPNSLPDGVLRSINESNKPGVFWIGSNRGLVKFDSNFETFQYYSVKDGLIDNVIYAGLEDRKGMVWMSTNRGVVVYDPFSENFTNYDVSDGLQGNEFNNNSFHISKSGEIFFGGVNGFNSFYPDQIVYNTYLPKVAITKLKIFNKEVSLKGDSEPDSPIEEEISLVDTITLNYEDRFLEFEFAGLHYSEPSKNKYAYKLEGFNKNWNYTSANNRHITYTNLDPGTYTLIIKASNNDGLWNEEGTSLVIHIIPRFWMTLWFKLLLVLLLVVAITYGIKYRVKNLRNQKKLLEETVSNRTQQILFHQKEIEEQADKLQVANEEITRSSEEIEKAYNLVQKKNTELNKVNSSLEQKVDDRTKELKEAVDELDQFIYRTSHDLRGPVASLIGLDYIVKKEVKDESTLFYFDIYNKQIQKIDKIIVDILELTKVKDWKTKKTDIDFEEVVGECINSFSYLPEFKKIDFEINIQKNLDYKSDKNLINSIVQNLIENGIKYSNQNGKPFVKVDVKKEKTNLCIKVEDNGIGIPKKFHKKIFEMFFRANNSNAQGSGLGMHIFKKAVDKLNGEVNLESEPDVGSTFVVRLPY